MKKVRIFGYFVIGLLFVMLIIFIIIIKPDTSLTLILSSLSGLIVILTIFFEGKITGKVIIPKQENNKLTIFGWILIALYILFTFGSIISTNQSIEQSEIKAYKDSISSAKIINELEFQRYNDSIKITNLENLTINNGLKSDSIKLAVVDNAINALEEQRLIIEKQHQNTYIQFKNEIEDNLEKIFTFYEVNRIKAFDDTLHIFTSIRLNNLYINNYKNISSNETIIDFLLELSESVETVNMYADLVVESEDLRTKGMNINMFLKNVDLIKSKLISIFTRTNNISNYKNYEVLDFSDSIFTPYDESTIKKYLKINKLIKEGKLKGVDKPKEKGATN